MSAANPFYQIGHKMLQIAVACDMDFPEHLHDHTEIIFVLENQLEVNINGVRKALSAGDCAVIFPEQVHSYHSPAANKVYLLIFDNSLVGSFLHMIKKYCPLNPFLGADILPEDVKLVFDRLSALIPENNTDFGGEAEGRKLLSVAWIQLLLALVIPVLQLEKNRKPESMDLTFRLVAYIMEHFQEPLTLELLAKELNVNKYYLSHTLSNSLHMDFRQYLNRIRMEYAMQAIQSNERPLTEIWMEAGFNSQRSFNRVFRDVAGMTPLEYRKKHPCTSAKSLGEASV